MGNVVISPKLKKVSERIDTSGNVIDPKTKQVISKNEAEYIPPVEEKKEEVKPVSNISDKINQMVAEKVSQRINEIVDKKVDEILSGI